MMKMQRPGLVLGNIGQHIRIGINNLVSTKAIKLNDADLVVTVNELTSRGDIRLGVHTPALISVVAERNGNKIKDSLNRLCLSRGVGTSVIIRKRDSISGHDALLDLKENGIYISNTTPALVKVGHKTGASLVFYANESIWKVVRLELTLLRGIN